MAKLKEKPALTQGDLRGSNTMMQLLSYVERFERLQEERDGLGDDQKEVMAEAKGLGFDTGIIRKVIQRRKADTATVMETDALLETYEEAIRQAEKQQVAQSVADGLPDAAVQAEAAKQIGAAADKEIPSFLRRKKA